MADTPRKKPARKTPTRHCLFLNSYSDMAFTKCPKCEGKTKVRKFPLFVHIEPAQPFVLNKICRFCPYCDLVIVSQARLEQLMAATFESHEPGILGNEYIVLGTLDRSDWRTVTSRTIDTPEVTKRVFIFKNQLFFEVTGGWRAAE